MRRGRWQPAGATALYTAGDIPEVGQLIGWVATRKAWRVFRVDDRDFANWDEQTLAAWEKYDRPEWRSWPRRERVVGVEPARNPAPDGKDRRGLRLFPWSSTHQWFPLEDPYPACVDCGLLWPCPCHDRNVEADAAMAELERLGRIMPGCCWACGEPVTGRHHSIVFDGENLLLPGAGPAVFHTSQSRKASRERYPTTCRAEAMRYEEQWIAADLSRPRRLRCPGAFFRHFAYSECSTGDDCPGESATHSDYHYCNTASFVWRGDATGTRQPEEVRPLTSCGVIGCRGPKPATEPTTAEEINS